MYLHREIMLGPEEPVECRGQHVYEPMRFDERNTMTYELFIWFSLFNIYLRNKHILQNAFTLYDLGGTCL